MIERGVLAGATMLLAMLVGLAAAAASTNPAPEIASREEVRRIVVQEAMRSRSVAPALALAIAEVESNFNAVAESSAGARGVMQLMPRTAAGEFGVAAVDLWEPRLNVQLGIAFLDDLLERYNGRLDLALSHYNGGSAVRRAGGDRVIPATRAYVRRVLRLYRHNRSDPDVVQLVQGAGSGNPALRLQLANRSDDLGSGQRDGWRRYLDLASNALAEADQRSFRDRGQRQAQPGSATALIKLIEATKRRFRRHLDGSAG